MNRSQSIKTIEKGGALREIMGMMLLEENKKQTELLVLILSELRRIS